MGRFQPNFRRPLAAKLWMGPKKLGVKWWHGSPLSSCKIWWKSRDARWRERMKCDVFHFFLSFFISFIENNAVGRRPLWCAVELLPQDIASAFVGRFRCGLQRFFGEEKPFPTEKQIWKLSLVGATIGATMRKEIFKIWENECKVCAHHFDHLKVSWKKTSTTALYPMYCRCAHI